MDKKSITSGPEISVVIALYNAEKEIGMCLDSIFNSDFKNFEVIIVDDCSTDSSLEIAKKYPCRIFSTEKNCGPARARNIGVSNSKSEIILFLDSDTRIEKDSIRKIMESFEKHKDIWAVIALPNITSLRNGAASNYNALRNHYTLYSAKEFSNYFTTQMGAIKKEAFNKLGDFNENFKSADIEDIEFGMRIPPGKVFINKEVVIGHHFPHFKSILKKYFRRAGMLTKLVKEKKMLSDAHANSKGMVSVIVVLLNLLFLILAWSNPLLLFMFMSTLFIFISLNFGLFSFSVQKRGASYLPIAMFFEYVFMASIGFGGVVETIKNTGKSIKEMIRKYFNLTKVFFSKKPTYLIFYVTAVCNSRCKMCFNWKYNTTKVLKEEMNLEEIDKFSKKMGYLQYVTLGGGEPFLRREIDKICEIFYKNNGAEIFSIPTNCLTPKIIAESTKKMLNRCPRAIFRVSMSIDGIGELHDYIRGVKGNFEKVKETYKLLNELRKTYPHLEILANTTFSQYNQDKIKEIHDYVRNKFKLDMYGLTLVRGNTRNFVAKKIDLKKYEGAIKIFEGSYFKDKGEMRHPLQRMLTILPIFTRREVIATAKADKRTYNCYAIERLIVIDSFGNVFACEMLPNKLGNLREDDYDLNRILDKKEAKDLIKSIQNKECNCTWECAIQNSMVFNTKKLPFMIKEAFFND